MRQLEIELNRLMISYAIWSIIVFAFTMFILYLVIRYAIRDGINDSKLANDWKRVTARARTDHLPGIGDVTPD